MSNWINHVKEFAKTKGITYNTALKDSDCKSTYHAKKTESKAVDTENKIEPISIPREMALDDKVVQSLTPSNIIRKRNKKPSINIEPNELKADLKTSKKGRIILSRMNNNIVI